MSPSTADSLVELAYQQQAPVPDVSRSTPVIPRADNPYITAGVDRTRAAAERLGISDANTEILASKTKWPLLANIASQAQRYATGLEDRATGFSGQARAIPQQSDELSFLAGIINAYGNNPVNYSGITGGGSTVSPYQNIYDAGGVLDNPSGVIYI